MSPRDQSLEVSSYSMTPRNIANISVSIGTPPDISMSHDELQISSGDTLSPIHNQSSRKFKKTKNDRAYAMVSLDTSSGHQLDVSLRNPSQDDSSIDNELDV